MLEYMSRETPMEIEMELEYCNNNNSVLLEIDHLVIQQNHIDLENHIKKEYSLTENLDNILDISNCIKFSRLNETLLRAFNLITEIDNKKVFDNLPLELTEMMKQHDILNFDSVNFKQIFKKTLSHHNLEPISIQIFISLAVTLCVHHIKIKNQIHRLYLDIINERQNKERLSKHIIFTSLIKYAIRIVDNFNKIFLKLIDKKNYILIHTLIQIIGIGIHFEIGSAEQIKKYIIIEHCSNYCLGLNLKFMKSVIAAIDTKNKLIIEIFLQNEYIKQFWTPIVITHCIEKDNLKTLKLFINYLNDVKFINKSTSIKRNLETFLHTAARLGRVNIIKYLLKLYKNNNIHNSSDTNKKNACVSDYINVLNKNKETAILLACLNNHLDCVKILWNNGAEFLHVLFHMNTYDKEWKHVSDDIIQFIILIVTSTVKTIFSSNEYLNDHDTFIVGHDALRGLQYYYYKQSINDQELLMNLSYDPPDIIDSFDMFRSFFKSLYLNWLKQNDRKSNFEKVSNLQFTLNNKSHGTGVTRYILDLISDFIKISGLLVPLFSSDVESSNMYLPHYENSPEASTRCDYYFLGIFLALVFLNNPTNLQLSPIIFKVLGKEGISLLDFLPDYMIKEFDRMQNYTNEDFVALDLNMVVRAMNSNGQYCEYELIENGNNILVDKSNFITYQDLILKYYLYSGYRKDLLSMICIGFYQIIKPKIVNSFISSLLINKSDEKKCINDWIVYVKIICNTNYLKDIKNKEEETEIIIDNNINTHKIKSLNKYFNIDYKNKKVPKIIEWFIQIINKMTNQEYNKLIKFISGTETLPMGGLKVLYESSKPIIIEYLPQLGNSMNHRLPTASTCLRMISLPYYKNKKTLKQYLFKAFDCNSLDFV